MKRTKYFVKTNAELNLRLMIVCCMAEEHAVDKIEQIALSNNIHSMYYDCCRIGHTFAIYEVNGNKAIDSSGERNGKRIRSAGVEYRLMQKLQSLRKSSGVVSNVMMLLSENTGAANSLFFK